MFSKLSGAAACQYHTWLDESNTKADFDKVTGDCLSENTFLDKVDPRYLLDMQGRKSRGFNFGTSDRRSQIAPLKLIS